MTRPHASRLSALAWIAGLLPLAAVGAELATRFDDWSRYGTPLASHATDVGDLIVRDSLGLHARPNGVFKYFRIDSLGFRGPDRSRGALAAQPVVVTTGASETFGLYEEADHEWPRRLEVHLASLVSDSSRWRDTAIVLNAAFAGMSLPTVAQDIRNRIAPLRPRVVVYYPTPAQYLFQTLPVAAAPLDGTITASSRPRLRIVQRLRDALKRLAPEALLDRLRRWQASTARDAILATESGFDFATESDARLAAFESGLRALVGDVRAIGAEPVLVVHAHRFTDTTSRVEQQWLTAWAKFYPLVSGAQLITFDSLAAERTRTVARDSAIALVDPRAALRAVGPSAFADHTHFSEAGADVVARAVAAALATPSRPATVAADSVPRASGDARD